LIQQTQYTPTPSKYNFPQLGLQDTALPTRFIELSLRSIKKIASQETALYQPYETLNENSDSSEEITPVFHGQTKLKLNTIPLKPIQEETPVVAIDVSSIKIGETTTGILLAIRGAIVWKNQRNHYHYLRIGPFPFHITEENKQEIHQLFRQYSLETPAPENNHTGSTPSLIHMQTRMTTLLERWLQMNVATQSQNTLILLDGSLTAGTSDSPTHIVQQLLETARNRLNTVLAFTKITRLRLSGHRLTDLIEKCTPPCLLEMDGYPVAPSNVIHFLGNIYVAKLTQGNCSFRLDIDRKLPREQAVEATQRLIANDQLSESYPETLRLAHIYSTFTANEVIAIQRFLAQTHNLKTITRPNIRRLLFGPFGKGPEGG
jgi:hypothetical protein